MKEITNNIFQRGLVLSGLALLLIAAFSFAQIDFDPERDVPMKIAVEPTPVPAEGTGNLHISLELPPNTHITSRELGFFAVEPEAVDGLEWGITSYPEGVTFEGETVYQGVVKISLPFNLGKSLKVGSEISVSGIVGYQICTEKEPVYCTAPVERQFSTVFTVGDPGAGGAKAKIPTDSGALTIEERAKRALESGSALALLWIFIGGVLLSFTPCVYPVIPITIAYIGARAGASKLKALSLSLVFVLGLAIVYSVLGLIAAASGGVFGLSTQNPIVIGFVTVVFLVMGIGMMGAFEIALPSSMQTALVSKKKSGYLGALFVGGTTGLIAAPCVGPVLVALLSWVATTGNILLGSIYLFVFACGLGTLFVVIGTFAGVLSALPKAGVWMERVKQVFGVILIAAAYYFAKPLISENWFTLLVGFGLMLLGGLMGAFSRLEADAEAGKRLGRGVAMFVIISGAFYTVLGYAKIEGLGMVTGTTVNVSGAGISAEKEASHGGVKWRKNDIAGALAEAKTSGKPVMVDFWAEWCAACKELDHKTFSVSSVSDFINQNFHPVKVDGTKITPEVKAVWAEYDVKGLPTVLFLTSDGGELARFEAFRTVDQVMPLLREVAEQR